MKFAKTCVALAAFIAPGRQPTPQPPTREIDEKAGEQTPLAGQILLEVRPFSHIGNFILDNSHIGSIVPADAFQASQSAR